MCTVVPLPTVDSTLTWPPDLLSDTDHTDSTARLAGERRPPRGELRRPLSPPHRVGDEALGLVAVGPQVALGYIDRAHDDRQHVVEVVRDAARQLTDRLHLLQLPDLRFGCGARGRFVGRPLGGRLEFQGAF